MNSWFYPLGADIELSEGSTHIASSNHICFNPKRPHHSTRFCISCTTQSLPAGKVKLVKTTLTSLLGGSWCVPSHLSNLPVVDSCIKIHHSSSLILLQKLFYIIIVTQQSGNRNGQIKSVTILPKYIWVRSYF